MRSNQRPKLSSDLTETNYNYTDTNPNNNALLSSLTKSTNKASSVSITVPHVENQNILNASDTSSKSKTY